MLASANPNAARPVMRTTLSGRGARGVGIRFEFTQVGRSRQYPASSTPRSERRLMRAAVMSRMPLTRPAQELPTGVLLVQGACPNRDSPGVIRQEGDPNEIHADGLRGRGRLAPAATSRARTLAGSL